MRKKQLHRLSNKDYVNMTADCISCGKGIKITSKGPNPYGKPYPAVRCATATRKDNKAGVLRLRKIVNDLKLSSGCRRCGYKEHFAALDFHHIDGGSTKEGSIAVFANRRMEKKMMEEIKKCEVLCANCHRIEHALDYQNKDKSFFLKKETRGRYDPPTHKNKKKKSIQ